MLKKIVILTAFVLSLVISSVGEAQRGGGRTGGLGGTLRGDEYKIVWQTDVLNKALTLAREQKKLLFLYLYFSNKEEDLMPDYDKTIHKYSKKQTVFAKVLIRTGSKGKIFDESVAKFFAIHKLDKLPRKPIAFILDQFGNLHNKVTPPFTTIKITSAIAKTDKKVIDIKQDFDKRYEKAMKFWEKDEPSKVIKELNRIVSTNWQGYKLFEQARKDLKELSKPGEDELKEIIKDFLAKEESKRDKEVILSELKNLCKAYKDLPVSEKIKKAINLIKKGKYDDLEEEVAE